MIRNTFWIIISWVRYHEPKGTFLRLSACLYLVSTYLSKAYSPLYCSGSRCTTREFCSTRAFFCSTALLPKREVFQNPGPAIPFSNLVMLGDSFCLLWQWCRQGIRFEYWNSAAIVYVLQPDRWVGWKVQHSLPDGWCLLFGTETWTTISWHRLELDSALSGTSSQEHLILDGNEKLILHNSSTLSQHIVKWITRTVETTLPRHVTLARG